MESGCCIRLKGVAAAFLLFRGGSMSNVLTIGEAMGLLVANEPGPLEEVSSFSRHVCGAELNYAVGMARLGNRVSYITKIGDDPFGRSICQFLQQNRISTQYITVDLDHMTGFQMKEKALEGDPLVANIRKHTAFSHIVPADLTRIDWTGVDHLHVTGIPLALTETCRNTMKQLLIMAREQQIPVSFDTNLRPMLWPTKELMIETVNEFARYGDIVMPGLEEGRILTGLETEQDIGRFYLDKGAKIVVIKLGGADGTYVCTHDRDYYVPSYHVERIVDTVGAGDGFAVGFTSALLEGLSLEEAALRGAAIGAMAIQVEGDNEGLPTRDALKKFQQAHL